jgi:hypothetical protein
MIEKTERLIWGKSEKTKVQNPSSKGVRLVDACLIFHTTIKPLTPDKLNIKTFIPIIHVTTRDITLEKEEINRSKPDLDSLNQNNIYSMIAGRRVSYKWSPGPEPEQSKK